MLLLHTTIILQKFVRDNNWNSFSSGPPTAPTLSCIELSEDVNGAVNVTVSWILSGGDSADFYLISITTNAPQTPYGGLLNITGIVTQYELTGFTTGYEYNITVHGICGSQMGSESEHLTITPQGIALLKYTLYVNQSSTHNSFFKLIDDLYIVFS